MAILKTADFSNQLDASYKEAFAEEYENCGFDSQSIRSSITMSIISEDATLFKVKVKTPYKEASYNIATKLQNLASDFVEGVTKTTGTLHVADSAKMPAGLSNSDNMARNTAIGFMLGALIAFLVLFLIEVFDVRIMSEEDIVNNYTTPLLGTIPLFQSDNRSKRGNR